jgi:hypothetical protein
MYAMGIKDCFVFAMRQILAMTVIISQINGSVIASPVQRDEAILCKNPVIR